MKKKYGVGGSMTQKEQALEQAMDKLLKAVRNFRPMLAFANFDEARDFVDAVSEAQRVLDHNRNR